MIRVEAQPEPAGFDERVRRPGMAALESGAGEKLPEYWRWCLPKLHDAYRGICAYLCIYIPKGVGTPSVDHFIPKSKARHLAYEWNNYRLACLLMNTRKSDFDDVLDPFAIEDGWFVLDASFTQILPAPNLPPTTTERVSRTINRLKLNSNECCDVRWAWYDHYASGEITFTILAHHAPLIAREIERQGARRPEK